MKQPKKLNSSWLANLVSQSSGFIFFLIATPFLMDSLGVEKYGALTILFLIPQIAMQLDLGIIATGTRVMAMFQTQSKFHSRVRVFWEMMTVLICIGVLQVFLFTFFSRDLMRVLQLDNVLNTQLSDVVMATSCWIFVSLLGAGVAVAARAFERFKLLAIIQALTASSFWLGAWILAVVNSDIVMIIWWGVIASVLTTMLLIFNVRKTIKLSADMVSDEYRTFLLPRFFHFSSGAFIAQASSLLTYHADKFLVAALISPSAVGIYNACANIASKILVFVSAIAAFAFPRAVRLHSQGSMAELSDVYLRATRACVMVAMIIAIPLASLAAPFLHLWLKDAYEEEYAIILILMVMGYFLASFSVVASNISIGMGRSRMPALFAIIGGGSTLILCALLAPKWGLYGAVIASVVGMSQALIFNWLVAQRLGTEQARQAFLLSISVILVWGMATFILSQLSYLITSWLSLILSGISIVIVIVYLWFASDFATKYERDAMLQIWEKIKW